jgi:heptaprenyl diphosphate synthase
MSKTRKLALLSILLSLALALHIFERNLPLPMAVPGIKLGLANIITLLTIIFFGFREAALVVFMRTFLGSMFGGGLLSFCFSLVGGLLSTIIMTILYKKFFKYFSIPAISISGAIFHNIGQITVASLIMENFNLFYYLPVLLISGIITGFFIGLIVKLLVKPLEFFFQAIQTEKTLI